MRFPNHRTCPRSGRSTTAPFCEIITETDIEVVQMVLVVVPSLEKIYPVIEKAERAVFNTVQNCLLPYA